MEYIELRVVYMFNERHEEIHEDKIIVYQIYKEHFQNDFNVTAWFEGEEKITGSFHSSNVEKAKDVAKNYLLHHHEIKHLI